MKKLLFAAALALSASIAHADEGAIHGQVKDATTGKPVAGASVFNKETGEQAITDDDGRFSLVTEGSTIVVIDPSYKRTEARFTGGDVAIAVEPVSVIGEEIIVVAERARESVGEVTITREEIIRVPGSRGDALSAVKNLPGVANTQGFGPNAGVVIRGSSPADSRIFVDGFEIPILYHLGGIQSVLPSDMIEDLTYSPGAFGVEYGRASAGVINVATRGGARELSGFAEVSFINAATMLQGPLGKQGSFALAARRSYIDAVIPLVVPSDEGLAFTALPRYYDYQGRAEYQVSKHLKLSAFLFGSDDKFAVATDGQDPNEPSRFENTARFTTAIAAATFDKPGVYNKLAVAAQTQRTGLTLGDDRFLRVKPDSLTVREEAKIKLHDRASLLAGGEARATDVTVRIKLPRPPKEGEPQEPDLNDDTLIDTTQSRTATAAAVWTAFQLKPTQSLETTVGVRVDDFRSNDVTVVQPRLQARYAVSKSTAVLGGTGLYTRPADNMDENLDQSLQPERSWQSSIGIEEKIGNGLTFTGTLYYNDRSDMLVSAAGRKDTAGMDGSGTYVNAGTGRSYGAELMLQARGKRFFGWAAYTYARSERLDDPMGELRLFDTDQTHNLIALGSVKFGKADKWQLGGRFQLTTGTPFTPVSGAIFDSDRNAYAPQYARTNSQRNPAQHQLDVRLDRSFTFQTWKLAAYLDIANVYVNAPVVGYEYNTNYTKRTETTGIPILPSFGLRGEF